MNSNKTIYNSAGRIWTGPSKKQSNYEGLSVGQVFFNQMKEHPDTINQISDSDGTSFTNAEMLKISIRIAQNLNTAQGMIGIVTSSSTYQAPVVYACMLNGTVFHAINPTKPKRTYQHLLSLIKLDVIFCDANNYDTLMAACDEINFRPSRIFTISGQVEGVPSVHELMKPTGREDSFSPRDCSKDEFDTMAILCSSGTTGPPKGICISHQRILEFLKPFEAGSVNFTFSNIDWISGLAFFVCNIVSSATRICTPEKFSPEKLRQIIEKYKVNHYIMCGSYLSQFIKSGEADLCDSSSIRQFLLIGGNISHPMLIKMRSLIKNGLVIDFYGGTEFGAISSTISSAKQQSVGQLFPGIKVRIVDNEDGCDLGVRELGEIFIQNESQWRGYINNPIETSKMFDKDAWFHSGDVGFFDEDGDLFLVDRQKHMIHCMGNNYSPQEIEDYILALSGVAEVCVFGIPNEKHGYLPTAIVKRQPGSNIDREEILNYVQRELPEEKWLHGGLVFVDGIPKNTNGKHMPKEAEEIFNKLKNNF